MDEDVDREPLAFRFRLVGCRIADLFGKELTGRRVDRIVVDSKPEYDRIVQFITECMPSRREPPAERPEPPLEPPVEWSRFQGLRVAP